MAARRGLVFYACGHQDPIPSGPDRHVARKCDACSNAVLCRICTWPLRDGHCLINPTHDTKRPLRRY